MQNIQSVQIVLPCSPFDETLTFFKDQLGFRIDMISPADDPSIAVISGYGMNIRLERNMDKSIELTSKICVILNDESNVDITENTELIAPNGTKIQFLKEASRLSIPPVHQSFVISRMNSDAKWVKGRAGMNYRDLIPGRQGGRFIASHIQILNGGPVADDVHYHNIRFQMIYIYKGWVRLLYEDQGQSFVLHAGDCVLQPPLIRHRVVESSPGLEVIEVACPAVHNTFIDHQIQLPTLDNVPNRYYRGQHFVKHIEGDENIAWKSWRLPNFEYHEMQIGVATENLAEVRIIRTNGDVELQLCQHKAELVFIFVLNGQFSLHINEKPIESLNEGDAFVIPDNLSYGFSHCSKDLRLLEISLPADFSTIFQ